MVDIIERTVVVNPELEHASSSRYTRISTLKISSEKKKRNVKTKIPPERRKRITTNLSFPQKGFNL